MSSTKACQHCGCSEIDTDPTRGDAVCTGCGSVLENSIIVSEIQFEENAHGGSRAIGQLISMDGTPGRSMSGFQHGSGKESREITLMKARRTILQVAGRLSLNQHCIDMAFNFYKMALTRHLTRGRRNSHVIAACIYMVCRIEGTPHMLLDLSDVVQVNVYELGKAFLKLSSAMCLNIPAIDPCLYIVRFAHHLEFGEKTHEVSMTALRMVQRMKRDWMHTGRRPSGLCGAALLVASRLHDFNRSVRDLVRVVKVCETTIRKRLTEFSDTPSSKLTLDEFMTIDLEEEQDPPCFKAARKKQKQLVEDQGHLEKVSEEVRVLQKQIEGQLEDRRKKVRGRFAKERHLTEEEENKISNEFIVGKTMETISACIDDSSQPRSGASTPALSVNGGTEQQPLVVDDNDDNSNPDDVVCVDDPAGPKHPTESLSEQLTSSLRPTAATLGLKESIQECMSVKDSVENPEESGDLDLEGLDDEELDAYIMTDAEVRLKTQFWTTTHAEYLKEMEEKEARKAQEAEENANKPETKKRKRRKKTAIQANTAGEAIEKMLQEKRISNKINYDVLKSLNSVELGLAPEAPPLPPGEGEAAAQAASSNDLDACEVQSVVSEPSKKKRKGAAPVPEQAFNSLMSTVKSIAMSQQKAAVVLSDDDEDLEGPALKKPKVSTNEAAMKELEEELEIQEDEEEEEEDFEEEEEEKEVHLSAAQLLTQHRGEEQDDDFLYHEDIDDYAD